MTRKAIVVTNCTNRKRHSGVSVPLASLEAGGTLQSVAARWVKAVRQATPSGQARDVYMGRAFVEAQRVADALQGTLHIVSAGLGIVGAADRIPSYDLTVSDGANSLKPLLARLGLNPSDWWEALTAELEGQHSISTLLHQHPDALALFALPGSYVSLVAEDLASLTRDQVNRIRIITSDHGRTLVPDNVRRVALPYDERLEGSPYAGTRTDFAQRAMRHFVEMLDGHRLSADEALASVTNAMRDLTKPVVPAREKKTDAEILALMRKNWHRFNGASSRLLRYLRDEALVACEQGRFRSLWCDLQQEFDKKE
ncbi:hypothetical protein [Paraburkholderia caribensis]|uniref:hypothetical protein n=1 Tax=Paraburkholderia caribensis TaxID=75105 RepID=UPI000722DA89|nr:hypothetical protein [Paraburkholderia caribensis]ALP61343.1 hypothetical protein AN416_01210 [Paraburkholderia caribensis]